MFTSGHDDPLTVARIERSAGHLRKPFDRAAVLEMIQPAVETVRGGRLAGSPMVVDEHPPRGEEEHHETPHGGRQPQQ